MNSLSFAFEVPQPLFLTKNDNIQNSSKMLISYESNCAENQMNDANR